MIQRQTLFNALITAVVGLCPSSSSAESEPFHVPSSKAPSYLDLHGNKHAKVDAPAGFQNTSFNVLTPGGMPESWGIVGAPLAITEQGNTFVRVNRDNRFQQEFFAEQNNQHLTFTALSRGTAGGESTSLELFQRVVNGGITSDIFQGFRGSQLTTQWQRYYYTADFLEQQGDTRFLVIPSSSNRGNWVDWDDFGIITVGFENGDFESAVNQSSLQLWSLTNAEILPDSENQFTGTQVLQLQPGGEAAQSVSLLAGEHLYLLSFQAFAQDSPATVKVERIIRDFRGDILSIEPLLDESLQAGETKRLSVSVDAPTTSTASLATYKFTAHESGGTLLLDDVHHGYALISPDLFNPTDTATYTTVETFIVFPQQAQQVAVRYRNPEGQVERFFLREIDANGLRDKWNPASTLSAGEWSVEIDLGDGQTTSTLTLPWRVAEKVDYELAEAPPQTEFEVSAWLWMRGLGITTAEVRPYIEQLKNDGIDYPVIFADRFQWAAIREVCEELAYDFVAADFELIYFYKRLPERNVQFSEERFRQKAEVELAAVLGSPNLLGLYLMDEPAFSTQAEQAALTNKVFSALTPPQPGYTIFATSIADPGALELIQPARYWTDVYPTQLARPNLRDNLLLLSANLEADVAKAKSAGIPHALVCQVFEIPDSFRVGPLGMVRATVGLAIAHGSQGLHPFAYISIGNNEGVRNRALELLPYGQTWLNEIQRLQPIKSDLIRREFIQPPQVTENYLFSFSEIPEESQQLVLVSLQARNPQQVTLNLSTNALLSEPTLGLPLQSTNNQITFTLEPGGWRYIEFPFNVVIQSIESELQETPQQLPSVPIDFQRSLFTQNFRAVETSPFSNDYAYLSLNSVYRTLFGSTIANTAVGSRLKDVAFQDSNTMIIADEAFGLYRVTSGFPQLNPPTSLSTRVTGNGGFLAVDANRLINAMGARGISVYDLTLSGTEIPRLAFTNQIGDARSVSVVPGANAFYVIDQDFGVRLMRLEESALGSLNITQQLVYQEDRVIDLDYEPVNKQLAVARLREGFIILQETETGNPLELLTSQIPGSESIDHVQWISPNLLAAIEWDGDSFFIARNQSGAWEPIAKWQTTITDATCTGVASNGSQLLLTFSTGTLVALNTTALQQLQQPNQQWVFY
ncbi:MAG: hypothetical protein ACFCU1_09895 [Sumerlaeia bacterium]